MTKNFDVSPLTMHVSDEEIADLHDRLSRTRWPDQMPGTGWDYGTDLAFLQRLCEHWRNAYEIGAFVDRMNSFPQYSATVDGQHIAFVHVRSGEPTARPLLLTHGWPGSVLEFWESIGPLTDPVSFGGDPADAFHVIIPALPGYGLSGPTIERGWNARRTAAAFSELMVGLGYERFFAQGGDWGSLVTSSLAAYHPDHVAAIHLNMLTVPAPKTPDAMDDLTESEMQGLADMQQFLDTGTGYQRIQSTRPQTLAYGLTDSPAGLAGWIVEKFRAWSDCGGDVERSFTFDQLLDDISLYWFTGTINSSTRLYYEVLGKQRDKPPAITVPIGHAAFPREIYRAPRRWAQLANPTLCHWTDMPRGGHFAALEEPELFVDDVRLFFRSHPL